ncbi:MAG TPA: hypothetical protein VEK07_15935 [Polyangiaceae bacterium]|nr:hypothetical protein [Polyangiaceae bacterium]
MTSAGPRLLSTCTGVSQRRSSLAPNEATSNEAAPESARVHRLLTVEEAARVLSMTATALRARCRRRARRVGRDVIARLGAGVVAFKFGVSWRLRIDPP